MTHAVKTGNADANPLGTPVIFGEVLFDCFEDGGCVLGGAAFNVAWNLQGLRVDPLFISRVGDDEAGRDVFGRMSGWGMRTDGVQTDAEHPTGQVEVRVLDGEPAFDIRSNAAYDFVEARPALAAAEPVCAAILYHGSLALRNEPSRRTLAVLRDRLRVPVFVDLNIRDPWYDPAVIEPHLHAASWLKVNEEELRRLAPVDIEDEAALRSGLRGVISRYGLEGLIVTRGARGVWFSDAAGLFVRKTPPPVGDVKDTVGAGDAFSAACLEGVVRGRATGDWLDRALQLSARVCRIQGATLQDRSVFDAFTGEEDTE